MTSIPRIVNEINAVQDRKGVIYAAGGGLSVFGLLGEHGGSSGTLLSGRIPYSKEDFADVLGVAPEHFVDQSAARQLASAAFAHALRVRGDLKIDRVFGIGSTSKLSIGRKERQGRKHEIHVALQTIHGTWVSSVDLDGPDRKFEEDINALLILNQIALAKGLTSRVAVEGFSCTDFISVEVKNELGRIPDTKIGHVLTRQEPYAAFTFGSRNPNGRPMLIATEVEKNPVIFPGSWRPLHVGHKAMREVAQKFLKTSVSYELSMFNADKPPLDYCSLYERLDHFADEPSGKIIVTNAPTFLDKARIFPGATFILGYDTAARLINPKYYGRGTHRERNYALDELEDLQTKFLVFGRIDGSGIFSHLPKEDWAAPDPRVQDFFAKNATLVPEDVFREDISSTMIREQLTAGATA